MSTCLRVLWHQRLSHGTGEPEPCGVCTVCVQASQAAAAAEWGRRATGTDIDALRDEARGLGVKRAGTMGEDRLRDEITKARADKEEGDEPDHTEETTS